MPSWNIHIAHTEHLLAGDGPVARAVCDRNAFLFGAVVPDIFVGYMVPGVAEPIPYRVTHFAAPEPIPKPREGEFWDTYVAPLLTTAPLLGKTSPEAQATSRKERTVRAKIAREDLFPRSQGSGSETREGSVHRATASALCAEVDQPVHRPPVPANPTLLSEECERLNRVHYPQRYADAPPLPPFNETEASTDPIDVARSTFDLTLGTWAHLLADNIWNMRVNEFLTAHGGKPSEQFRIKKQADFDWFGKTLAIDAVPRATERLYRAAEAFAQYPIEREYVLKVIGVMHEIVRSNPGEAQHPPYQLLTEEFFSQVFDEVTRTTDDLLARRLS